MAIVFTEGPGGGSQNNNSPMYWYCRLDKFCYMISRFFSTIKLKCHGPFIQMHTAD